MDKLDKLTDTIINFKSFSKIIEQEVNKLCTSGNVDFFDELMLLLHNLKLNLEFETKYIPNKNCTKLIDVLISTILVEKLQQDEYLFTIIDIAQIKQLIVQIQKYNNIFLNYILQLLLKFSVFESHELNIFVKHNVNVNAGKAFRLFVLGRIKKMLID